MPQRDKLGHFVKKTVTVSTPDSDINPEFEKPVVSVTVNNPIKKILYWLDQIRKKQTTTFAIKLSIPLIALPIIIFVAFQLGKGSSIQSITATPPPTGGPTAKPSASPTPQVPYSRTGTLKIAKIGDQTKYVLGLKNGDNVVLQIPQTLDVKPYQNKQVLITGYFNRTANLIEVLEIAEIEVFNETTVASPSPTPKSESTQSAQ